MKKDDEIPPRGRPRKHDGEPSYLVIHLRIGQTLRQWIDVEWHRRGLETRADALRAILQESMQNHLSYQADPSRVL